MLSGSSGHPENVVRPVAAGTTCHKKVIKPLIMEAYSAILLRVLVGVLPPLLSIILEVTDVNDHEERANRPSCQEH